MKIKKMMKKVETAGANQMRKKMEKANQMMMTKPPVQMKSSKLGAHLLSNRSWTARQQNGRKPKYKDFGIGVLHSRPDTACPNQ